jgi:hypothetical protein
MRATKKARVKSCFLPMQVGGDTLFVGDERYLNTMMLHAPVVIQLLRFSQTRRSRSCDPHIEITWRSLSNFEAFNYQANLLHFAQDHLFFWG